MLCLPRIIAQRLLYLSVTPWWLSTWKRHLIRSAGVSACIACDQDAVLWQGGYDLKALGDSVADTLRGLLAEPSRDTFSADLLREEPMDAVRTLLREARSIHGL